MDSKFQTEINELFLNAASQGDIEKAIDCLTQGAQLNTTSPKGYNALVISASRKNRDFFEWILDVTQKGQPINVNNKDLNGDTVLYQIVKEDLDIFYTRKLLDKGAHVDLPSSGGVTPLLKACANVNFEQAQVLLEYKADPNFKTKENKTTPFLMAGAEGNFDLVKLLLENGANINEIDGLGRNVLLSSLFKPMTYMKKMEKVAHEALLMYLVKETNINIDYIAPTGVSALWLASMMGKTNLVAAMLEKTNQVDLWHEMDINAGKMSVLHQCCKLKDAQEVVKTLLEKGAKLSVPDGNGNFPEAYGFFNPSLRQTMLDNNADVNAVYTIKSQDVNGKDEKIPVLTSVLMGGDTEKPMVEEMVKRGARISYNEPDMDKHDPLMIAIVYSAPETVKFLLEQNVIDVNKRLNMNETVESSMSYMDILCGDLNGNKLAGKLAQKKQFEALMKAKKVNEQNGIKSDIVSDEQFAEIEKHLEQLEKMEELLEKNKNIIFDTLMKSGYKLDVPDKDGQTEIFKCKKPQSAQWLKEAGANIYHKDNNGNDLLTHYVANNHKEMFDFIKPLFENRKEKEALFYNLAFTEVNNSIAQDLLQKGIINFTGNEELKKPFKKDEEYIIQHIEGINYQDTDGNTPLMVACANDLPFLASLYIKMGADVNQPNHLGETPLMHAINTQNNQLIEFLIGRGADCNAKTLEGKSVKEFAEETGKWDLQKIITKGLSEEAPEEKQVKKIKP